MDEVSCFAGVDVSKARLDVHVLPQGESFAVAHDDQGLNELTCRLAGGGGSCLVVLEATGGLQERAAAGLSAAGLTVAVVNPRQVRDFARATGRLAKLVLGPASRTRGPTGWMPRRSPVSRRPSGRLPAPCPTQRARG
jgi:transposase